MANFEIIDSLNDTNLILNATKQGYSYILLMSISTKVESILICYFSARARRVVLGIHGVGALGLLSQWAQFVLLR